MGPPGVLGLPPVLLTILRILDGLGLSPVLSPLGILSSVGLAPPLVVIDIQPLSGGAHRARRSGGMN